MYRFVTLALFVSTPALAQDACPVELTRAEASLEVAREAHQDARADLYDDNWKARLSMARDRDEELAHLEEAQETVDETRRERRAARRALRSARRTHPDADSCVSNGFGRLLAALGS